MRTESTPYPLIGAAAVLLLFSVSRSFGQNAVGEVMLTNGATRPFLKFTNDTMYYTAYPLRESADLVARCRSFDSSTTWTSVRTLEFLPFTVAEQQIIRTCEFCDPIKSPNLHCNYKKANIVLKDGKALTGAYVDVSGYGAEGPGNERYWFWDRVKSFSTK